MCFKAFLVVVFLRGFVLVSIFSLFGFFFFRDLELALVSFFVFWQMRCMRTVGW